MMEDLHFYDCNSFFGMRKNVAPGSFYKKEDLLERMTYYSIEKALVHHSMAIEYDPLVGNNILMDELVGIKNLVPAWVVLPHHTGEFPAPDKLIEDMKIKGVCAAIIRPNDYSFCVSEWNCGQLFSALEEHGIPLFISNSEITFDELHTLCSLHSDLNVVFTNVTYRVSRNLYPLMKKFKHLYLETSGYIAQDGIENVCSVFGANRLIFGSGMPVHSGASAVNIITYANISQNEKQMIASGNLERLLGGEVL